MNLQVHGAPPLLPALLQVLLPAPKCPKLQTYLLKWWSSKRYFSWCIFVFRWWRKKQVHPISILQASRTSFKESWVSKLCPKVKHNDGTLMINRLACSSISINSAIYLQAKWLHSVGDVKMHNIELLEGSFGYIITALYKVLLRAQEITTWSHITFSLTVQGTYARSPPRPHRANQARHKAPNGPRGHNPWAVAQLLKNGEFNLLRCPRERQTYQMFTKCIVSNIAIYDYPYHDWFYIRVYNIIYTYILCTWIYIYRVIYHSYCAYVCSLTSHSWTHDTHTNMMQQQRASWVLE